MKDPQKVSCVGVCVGSKNCSVPKIEEEKKPPSAPKRHSISTIPAAAREKLLNRKQVSYFQSPPKIAGSNRANNSFYRVSKNV